MTNNNPASGYKLDTLDHVAIVVPNIAQAVDWYTRTFECEVSYQDDTWAFIEFDNVKLALVRSGQHPAHIALLRKDAEKFGKLTGHRDGTWSCYIEDPAGNSVEIEKAG
jgi:catechol 2,3-dioxygenase-like lactoylglutathione lyase family enzyme